MCRLRRKCFTLIELVAAIAIIVVATGVATATIRSGSPARKLENAALEFEAFCARVRFRAIESGEPWSVCFAPGAGEFRARSAAGAEPENESGGMTAGELKFKLAETIRFETPELAEEQLFDDETLEVFRFFSNGAAAGKYKLILHCGDAALRLELSQLTGALLVNENTEEQQ